MQKPADGDVDVHPLGSLPDHKREEHKVVIVDPDLVAVFQMGHNGVCEDLVRSMVRKHGIIVERDLVELVVEQRPYRGVCHHKVSTLTCNRCDLNTHSRSHYSRGPMFAGRALPEWHCVLSGECSSTRTHLSWQSRGQASRTKETRHHCWQALASL
jgi:hypothetical protein